MIAVGCVVATLFAATLGHAQQQQQRASPDPNDFVSPFIGTGGLGYGDGSTPPGAQWPFGLCRLSPDTCESFDFVIPFQHFGGYYYDDVVVRAFTHVHMQGSGAVDLGAVGAMPYTGALDAASIDPIGEGFRQTMNKATEQATPGYYAVRLANDVDVELSATPLCGHHRITFGAAAPAQALLVLPSITIAGERGHLNVSLTLDAARGTASGVVQVDESLSSRQTDGLPIYFWMALRLPSGVAVGSVGTWRGATLTPNATQSSATRGIATGGYFQFVGVARGASLTVELVVGLSLIDVATAQRNALSEIPPTQTFDDTRANAAAAWRDALQRVDVTAPTTNAALWTRRLRTFYTGLYHAHSAPTNYTEWPTSGGGGGGGGTYRGMDGDVHRAARGATYFSDMSIWDIHRTQTPLLALLRRDIASDVVRSLLAMYSDGGALPRWPLATVYTGCMVGSHANVIIADAWFRGVPLDNATLAVEATWRALRDPTLPHEARSAPLLAAWLEQGFLPDNLQDRSGAVGLDWAYDDGVTAKFLAALGFAALARNLSATAANFKNQWHDGLMCTRHNDANGNAVFNCPNQVESYFPWDSRYVEDNAQVYSYFVLHDVPALIALNGGNASFVARLQAFAECSFDDTFTILPDPCIWIGNEPSLAVPWLFNFAGRADLTQIYTHRLASTFFSDQPDGLPGNDDYGTTSSWMLFAMLGFYPLAGSDLYILGSPMFPRFNLTLDASRSLTIVAHNFNADGSSDVASKAALNGRPIDMQQDAFVRHGELTALANNVLEFWMD